MEEKRERERETIAPCHCLSSASTKLVIFYQLNLWRNLSVFVAKDDKASPVLFHSHSRPHETSRRSKKVYQARPGGRVTSSDKVNVYNGLGVTPEGVFL